jgi:hypothetical protein
LTVNLTLLQKVYGPRKTAALRLFQDLLSKEFSKLNVRLDTVEVADRGWLNIELSGEDEAVAANYLEKRFGSAKICMEEIDVPTTVRGKIVSSGRVGYGIYVDIGINSSEPVDALIPLDRLRAQLTDGKKLSVKQIITLYCLHDNFPIEVLLSKVDLGKREIEAELSEGQRRTFLEWVGLEFDRVIVLGLDYENIDCAIQRARVGRYILEIDALGLMEHALVCKLGVDAPGIITKVGHHLARTPLHAFSPKKIKRGLFS